MVKGTFGLLDNSRKCPAKVLCGRSFFGICGAKSCLGAVFCLKELSFLYPKRQPILCVLSSLASSADRRHCESKIAMRTREFFAFRQLLASVHQKAFGEPLSPLSYSRAQALSWLIEEATGKPLSYKTLANYAKAALEDQAGRVNPHPSTLVILVQYLQGNMATHPLVAWQQYCCQAEKSEQRRQWSGRFV